MSIKDEPILASVAELFSTDFNELYQFLTKNRKFYIFDNMILSIINKLSPNDIKNIIQSLVESDTIILPEYILKESYRNIPSRERFDELYLHFFKEVANYKKIFVTSMDTLYDLVFESVGNEKNTLAVLQLLATESTRSNRDINVKIESLNLQQKNALNRLIQELKPSGNNGGERIINLTALVLLHEYFGPAFICSNDKGGTFSTRGIYIKSDTLKQLFHLNEKQFREQYQILSYDQILQMTIENLTLNQEQAIEFVQRCRSAREENRKMFCTVYGEVEVRIIENQRFVELILDKAINITF